MAVLLRDHAGTQQVYPIFKQVTRLGADTRCDVVLCGPDIATEHAQIVRDGAAFMLTTLGSQQTVWVNGRKGKRLKLAHNDVLRLGSERLTFSMLDAAPHEPAHTPAACLPQSAGTPDAVLQIYQKIVAFSHDLLRRRDLDTLLTALMDAVIDLTGADKGFLLLQTAGEPQIRVARNMQREHCSGQRGDLSDTIVAKVLQEKAPVLVQDAAHDAEFNACLSVINLRLASVMCVPLAEADELLGLIYLGSSRAGHLFTPDMLQAATIFATLASLLIRNAMLLDNLRCDNAALRQAMQARSFGAMIGSCEGMQDIYRKISRVAPTDVSVLITGETGTGKELLAREIHRHSDRADKPFVVVHCSAIPENLLESELFGHVRGAFTGASATRAGRFQSADTGTVFLDEIGDMPLRLQVKILRVLQEKMVTKVGDNRAQVIDIRIIAATHRNLEELIKTGGFREDLYYRLNVVGLHLPPLRQRGTDLMHIANFLLKRYAQEYNPRVKGFAPQCALLMQKYPWPGNIRQLENRLKRAIILADRAQLTAADLELADTALAPVLPLAAAKEEFQRNYINAVLARNHGNRTRTAQELDVDPRTIFRHLERAEETPCPNTLPPQDS